MSPLWESGRSQCATHHIHREPEQSLGLMEAAAVSHTGRLNEPIVAVCAGGLVAGLWVGLAANVFVSWLAVAYDDLPQVSIGLSMLLGSLAGGYV
jgi:hypothetical protein